MQIKKVIARDVKNSRGENTIQVEVETSKGRFVTSAPAGKSKGRFEARGYHRSLRGDISYINNLDAERINELGIEKFEDLKWIERLVFRDIGANSLFALEASILKAMARENNQELFEFLSDKKIKLPMLVGNAIGGGVHSCGVEGRKPDFQEFLFIPHCKKFSDCVKINEKAYRLAGKMLKARRRNDEGAWESDLSNQQILIVMKNIQRIIREKYKQKVDIGLDVAASSFYKNRKYIYKNAKKKRDENEQIGFISDLINAFGLSYVEDGLNENNFDGFRNLLKKIKKKGNCLIVGDDLTVTNVERLKKAIKMKSVNAVIVKPNQIGSLLEVKEVVDLCRKKGIKTIMSHRSGETRDDTIADLAVGFGCDFIKTGIYGSARRAKLKRLMRIERKIK